MPPYNYFNFTINSNATKLSLRLCRNSKNVSLRGGRRPTTKGSPEPLDFALDKLRRGTKQSQKRDCFTSLAM